jgi:hypothetical protein
MKIGVDGRRIRGGSGQPLVEKGSVGVRDGRR